MTPTRGQLLNQPWESGMWSRWRPESFHQTAVQGHLSDKLANIQLSERFVEHLLYSNKLLLKRTRFSFGQVASIKENCISLTSLPFNHRSFSQSFSHPFLIDSPLISLLKEAIHNPYLRTTNSSSTLYNYRQRMNESIPIFWPNIFGPSSWNF